MPTLEDTLLDALDTSHDRLVAVVSGLSEEQLAGASGAADWDISQVLSHLGSGAEIGRMTLEAALAGTGAVPRERILAVWDRWNAMSREERRAGFLESDAALLQGYRALDTASQDSVRFDLGFLPAPVGLSTVLLMRASEHTLHSWDVRVGLDPLAALDPATVAVLVDNPVFPLGMLAKPAVLEGRPVQVDVTLTDPARQFGLELGETVAVGEQPAAPTARLSLPAEAWLRLVSGRLSPEHTPGSVSVEGDLTLDELRQVFPGY